MIDVHECNNLKNPGVTVHNCLLFTFSQQIKMDLWILTQFCSHEQCCFEDSHNTFSFKHLFSLWGYICRSVQRFTPQTVMCCGWKSQTTVQRPHYFTFSQAIFKSSNFLTSMSTLFIFSFLSYSHSSVCEGGMALWFSFALRSWLMTSNIFSEAWWPTICQVHF